MASAVADPETRTFFPYRESATRRQLPVVVAGSVPGWRLADGAAKRDAAGNAKRGQRPGASSGVQPLPSLARRTADNSRPTPPRTAAVGNDPPRDHAFLAVSAQEPDQGHDDRRARRR